VLDVFLLEAPEPMSARRPDVPAALDALVARMLAKSPDQRPDAAEVAQALAAIGRGGARGKEPRDDGPWRWPGSLERACSRPRPWCCSRAEAARIAIPGVTAEPPRAESTPHDAATSSAGSVAPIDTPPAVATTPPSSGPPAPAARAGARRSITSPGVKRGPEAPAGELDVRHPALEGDDGRG